VAECDVLVELFAPPLSKCEGKDAATTRTTLQTGATRVLTSSRSIVRERTVDGKGRCRIDGTYFRVDAPPKPLPAIHIKKCHKDMAAAEERASAYNAH
jgi:hypothetical protein